MKSKTKFYQESFEKGMEFEDFVTDAILDHLRISISSGYKSERYQLEKGENPQAWEIKLDTNCTKTNRLSIEVGEKSRKELPKWTPSGILRDDNTIWYVQGNYDCFWVFFKKHLIYIYENEIPADLIEEKLGTVKTFYLNIPLCNMLGIPVLCNPDKMYLIKERSLMFPSARPPGDLIIGQLSPFDKEVHDRWEHRDNPNRPPWTVCFACRNYEWKFNEYEWYCSYCHPGA